jgi:hypothetical protein
VNPEPGGGSRTGRHRRDAFIASLRACAGAEPIGTPLPVATALRALCIRARLGRGRARRVDKHGNDSHFWLSQSFGDQMRVNIARAGCATWRSGQVLPAREQIVEDISGSVMSPCWC